MKGNHMAPQATATTRPITVVNDWYTIEDYKQLSPAQQEAALTMKPKGKFNQQKNDLIEWARWSWNPITGCLHNCPYCYARDIAQDLYPTKFTPTLWPNKIAVPRLMTPPERAKTEIGYKNVFVCSMADLFGKWVPQSWIEAVLRECRQAKEWNFLFLTKFPSRLAEFNFADNMWVGTTVDCQARVKEAEKAFQKVEAKVKWLSCEPLIEPLKFSSLEMFDWLVVGGASPSAATAGTKATPDYIPPSEWLGMLYVEAAKHGIPVYEKTNGRPREYPGSSYVTTPKDMQYLPS